MWITHTQCTMAWLHASHRAQQQPRVVWLLRFAQTINTGHKATYNFCGKIYYFTFQCRIWSQTAKWTCCCSHTSFTHLYSRTKIVPIRQVVGRIKLLYLYKLFKKVLTYHTVLINVNCDCNGDMSRMPGMQKTGCIFFLPRKVKKGSPLPDDFLCLPTPSHLISFKIYPLSCLLTIGSNLCASPF